MSHALATDARQMCAAMSHVWCNSREDNCAFFLAAFLLPNPGSFGKFSKYIYFWNLQPYMLFSVRSTLSWPNLFLLEDNCAFFLAAFLLPFQLCSTQDRLENSLSKYMYFWNLEPYMLFSVRSTLGWPNLFLQEDNCACFWAAFLLHFQPRIVWKIL